MGADNMIDAGSLEAARPVAITINKTEDMIGAKEFVLEVAWS